ncbi:Hypothetical protein FKW44_000702 [Caligus rogercresseyi]|uniref:Uncharacterized protein n=1 Tax=Caligus rogercresseyi TaxID=217165 RepID=A0A7T8KHQ5_CALRO|nr:Hypothetical protein FKW44_000702 [Caligus rogercresseyi]
MDRSHHHQEAEGRPWVQEVTVSQTGKFLARAICQMHMDFGIQNKVNKTEQRKTLSEERTKIINK